MENNWKKRLKGFDEWSKAIDELAKNVPDDDRFDERLDEIIAELERGDYSSLGPELQREIEEREKKEKRKKVAKPREKEESL